MTIHTDTQAVVGSSPADPANRASNLFCYGVVAEWIRHLIANQASVRVVQ